MKKLFGWLLIALTFHASCLSAFGQTLKTRGEASATSQEVAKTSSGGELKTKVETITVEDLKYTQSEVTEEKKEQFEAALSKLGKADKAEMQSVIGKMRGKTFTEAYDTLMAWSAKHPEIQGDFEEGTLTFYDPPEEWMSQAQKNHPIRNDSWGRYPCHAGSRAELIASAKPGGDFYKCVMVIPEKSAACDECPTRKQKEKLVELISKGQFSDKLEKLPQFIDLNVGRNRATGSSMIGKKRINLSDEKGYRVELPQIEGSDGSFAETWFIAERCHNPIRPYQVPGKFTFKVNRYETYLAPPVEPPAAKLPPAIARPPLVCPIQVPYTVALHRDMLQFRAKDGWRIQGGMLQGRPFSVHTADFAEVTFPMNLKPGVVYAVDVTVEKEGQALSCPLMVALLNRETKRRIWPYWLAIGLLGAGLAVCIFSGHGGGSPPPPGSAPKTAPTPGTRFNPSY